MSLRGFSKFIIFEPLLVIPTLEECSAKLSVTYAPAAVPGGVFEGNPAPGMAQGALNDEPLLVIPTLEEYLYSYRTRDKTEGKNAFHLPYND